MTDQNSEYSNIHDVDYSVKIAFVGSANTGKTTLFKLFCDKLGYSNNINFDENCSTIGVDFGTLEYSYKNENFKFQFWDTAGHEKFRTITRAYYRNIFSIILLFDLNNKTSFTDLQFWMTDIRRTNENVKIILIGNKNDLEKRVSNEQIDFFCKTWNIQNYFEISSKIYYKENKDLKYILNCIPVSIREIMSHEHSKHTTQNSESFNKNIQGLKVHKKPQEVVVKTKKCCFY
jgi:small GTP-binding protein